LRRGERDAKTCLLCRSAAAVAGNVLHKKCNVS
jgi:hypothetical protein